MKAISIQQPWASMIVFGFKPVENRKWRTTHRGPLLIHASFKVDKDAIDWLWTRQHELGLTSGWNLLPFRTGGIIGQVDLHDVTSTDKHRPDGRWFFGPYGFWMRDARAFPLFRPLRGQLGIFEVPDADPA